jgi:hypothetical protein
MSIIRKIRTSTSRTSTSRGRARGSRDLARAMASAPTRASREELYNLANMGR